MNTEIYFIVQYNDCYGNGDKENEVLVKDENTFLRWLAQRNQERSESGELEENVEEFDLIPIAIFK